MNYLRAHRWNYSRSQEAINDKSRKFWVDIEDPTFES